MKIHISVYTSTPYAHPRLTFSLIDLDKYILHQRCYSYDILLHSRRHRLHLWYIYWKDEAASEYIPGL